MPRFAANLSMMFNEVAFLDRFGRAAAAGFEAVEYLFPYDFAPEEIADRLRRHGLTQALFNLPPGDWAAGDRGIACHAERFAEFAEGVERALVYVRSTGVKRIHLMSGLGDKSDPAQVDAYRRAVRHAAGVLAPHGVDVLLEPINGRDMPGYFLNDFAWAGQFIEGLGLDNVKLQFDVYHRQVMRGDVTVGLREMMPIIGHIQIASVPERHEPTGDELDWSFLFRELDRLGHAGFVGCEYRPAGRTEDGLSWFAPWAKTKTAEIA